MSDQVEQRPLDRPVMRHWEEINEELKLKECDRVVSIWKAKDNDNFFIGECCDDWFAVNFSRDEVIIALEEAIEWIKSQ